MQGCRRGRRGGFAKSVKGRLLQQLFWSPNGQRLALSIFSLPQVFTTIYQLKPFNITE
ncbi:hypothetical protein [Brevibacillus porteri]|uniref:hypothetical protein n=1 Tax=Brevibacillus porteri TaxID=2126350 RepID=UPI003D1A8167